MMNIDNIVSVSVYLIDYACSMNVCNFCPIVLLDLVVYKNELSPSILIDNSVIFNFLNGSSVVDSTNYSDVFVLVNSNDDRINLIDIDTTSNIKNLDIELGTIFLVSRWYQRGVYDKPYTRDNKT